MARKKWSKLPETGTLVKSREKRKWQIALRRYVLEGNISVFYAPYFGLDIENLRKWFETQFDPHTSWIDFGQKWQFSHIIPVSYFDSSDETELKMCWNFINLRIEYLQPRDERENRADLLHARKYLKELYSRTQYPPCLTLLDKLDKIESVETINTDKQQAFLRENMPFLNSIEGFSAFEFELLNSGKAPAEIKKDIAFFKKFEK